MTVPYLSGRPEVVELLPILIKLLYNYDHTTTIYHLPRVLPSSLFEIALPMCRYEGISAYPNWQTLFPPRIALPYFLPQLKLGRLYVCSSLAFINGRLLTCTEVVTKEKSFWTSHFKNIFSCSLALTCLNQPGTQLELRISYREAFDAIIDICEFPSPITGILKDCFGDPFALKVILALLPRNIDNTPPSTDWRQSSPLLRLLSTKQPPFRTRFSMLDFLTIEKVIESTPISLHSLNMFRGLMAMPIAVNMGVRIFYNIPISYKLWCLFKRVSDNLRPLSNVYVMFTQLPSAPFDHRALAIHQLSSPTASISGYSYGKGSFNVPTASTFSTIASNPTSPSLPLKR
ncbi:MAG: hypothetical protein ACKEQK_00570 [Candidatus Hodgkinia cicadicola]